MTAVLAASPPGFERPSAPVRPRRDERWLTRDRRSRGTKAALAAVGGSLLLHALLLTLVAKGSLPSRPSQPAPISVELVQNVPEPRKAPEPKAPAPETPRPRQEAAVPPPQLKPTLPPPPPPAPQPPAPVEAKPANDLRDELAKLKAEQASLQAALQSARAELQTQRAPAPPTLAAAGGKGLLPQSFQAVALPSGSNGEGEAVSYAELVFSQLAKAKGIGHEQGQPGTASVRFDIDASGKLLDVELAVSSGVKALDDEALAVVRKAAPFPPPPAGAQRRFSANVSFVADQASP